MLTYQPYDRLAPLPRGEGTSSSSLRLEETHQDAIRSLGEAAFQEEFWEIFHTTLKEADRDSLVVLNNNSKVVAFALLARQNRFGLPLGAQNNDCLELAYLVVDPAFQGQGIGSTLLQKVKELSPLVILEVSHTNPNAERLYKKHGFERWRRLYTEPNHGYLMGWSKTREERLTSLRSGPD